MRKASRRRFLAEAGAVTLVGAGTASLLAGCSHRASQAREQPETAEDLARLTAAARVDVLAVEAYDALLAGAGQGHYGSLPPGVPGFWQTLRAHHSSHVQQANALLASARAPAVSQPDPGLAPSVLTVIGQARELSTVTSVLIFLESSAAATHQDNAAHLSGTGATKLAAAIAPIEAQHVALWNLLAGRYPGYVDSSGSPLAFSLTSMTRFAQP